MPKHEGEQIWKCKVGAEGVGDLVSGADSYMRKSIAKAFETITGKEPDYCFSSWGSELNPVEQDVVDDKAEADLAKYPHLQFKAKLEELWSKYWSTGKTPPMWTIGPLWKEMGELYGKGREALLKEE